MVELDSDTEETSSCFRMTFENPTALIGVGIRGEPSIFGGDAGRLLLMATRPGPTIVPCTRRLDCSFMTLIVSPSAPPSMALPRIVSNDARHLVDQCHGFVALDQVGLHQFGGAKRSAGLQIATSGESDGLRSTCNDIPANFSCADAAPSDIRILENDTAFDRPRHGGNFDRCASRGRTVCIDTAFARLPGISSVASKRPLRASKSMCATRGCAFARKARHKPRAYRGQNSRRCLCWDRDRIALTAFARSRPRLRWRESSDSPA